MIKEKIDHIKITDNSFLVVRVGSNDRPATQEDLEHVEKKMYEALGEKFPDLPIVVTHHNLDVKLYTCK